LGAAAMTTGTLVEAAWLYWRSRPAASMLVPSVEDRAAI